MTLEQAATGAATVSCALERRRSVRAFLDRPVSRDQIERILRQAARLPSGGNLQPWHVRLIDGERMADFKRLIDRRLVEAPEGEDMPCHFYSDRLTEAQLRRRERNGEIVYSALGIDRSDSEARRRWNLLNFRFFGGPWGVFPLPQGSLRHLWRLIEGRWRC